MYRAPILNTFKAKQEMSPSAQKLLASYQSVDIQLYKKFKAILKMKINRFGNEKMKQRVAQLSEMNAYVKLKCEMVLVKRGHVSLWKAK